MAYYIDFDSEGNLRGRYLTEVHGNNIPAGSIEVPHELWQATMDTTNGPWIYKDGKVIQVPYPIVVPPLPTCEDLCAQVDKAADVARMAVVVDPVRAIEYDRARVAAEEFKAAGYPDDNVPSMVKSWAIGGRSATDAANNILAEAQAYTGALEFLRATRLSAKQALKDLFAAGDVDGAILKASKTIAAIEAAVEGVGNAKA